MVDYFGQTVNIASRLQHLAEPKQICTSETFASEPAVAELLGSLRVQARQSAIRGLDRAIEIRVIDCA